jgi:hypothetical protein
VDEQAWLTCNDIVSMLIYLRGEVEPPPREPDPRPRLITAHGPLIAGDGTRLSSGRLGRFAQQCCRAYWDLPLDEASRHLVRTYERFLVGDGAWAAFQSAVQNLWETSRGGAGPLIRTMGQWSLTPYGIANLVQNLAWTTASYLHREQIEELERIASDDDRFAWGFFGYDFPQFSATARGVYAPLPDLLREVVGNPFRPLPPLHPSVLTWNGDAVVPLARAIDDEQAGPAGMLDNARLAVLADALEEAGCVDTGLLAHLRSPGPHVHGCFAVDAVSGRA